MTEFKIRCSAIADITSNPKEKSPAQMIASISEAISETTNKYNELKTKDGVRGLGYVKKLKALKKEKAVLLPRRDEIVISDTCRQHLRRWYNYQYYGRRKNIESKYTKKGIIGEEKSTTLLNKVYAKDYQYKGFVTSKGRDIKRKTDAFKTGECDIWIEFMRHIRDVKTSWDYDTFPGGPLAKEKLNPRYRDQIKGYADLWKAEVCFVDYCLIDTPTRIVVDELRKLDWRFQLFGIDGMMAPRDEHIPLIIEKVSNMIYTRKGLEDFLEDPLNGYDLQLGWFDDFIEIPEKDRIKTYEVLPDPTFIEEVHERVALCREYLDQKGISQLKKAA